MLQRFKNLFILGFLSMLLAACGGGGDFTSSPGIPEFNGTWVSDCETDGTISAIDTTTIAGTSATVVLDEYSSADCSGSVSNTSILKATLFYGLDVPTASSVCTNVKEVDFNITSINLNGTELTVAGIILFSGLPTTTIYDLICSEGNQLFTGELTATLDGSTAAKRPEYIDHSYPLTKK
jgi:hypothetical protein